MEKNKLFLTQLLMNYEDKYPEDLSKRVYDIMKNHGLESHIDVDTMSEEDAGMVRSDVEKAIEECGLKIDAFESKRVMLFEQFKKNFKN